MVLFLVELAMECFEKGFKGGEIKENRTLQLALGVSNLKVINSA